MKKKIALVLSLICVVTLFGCNNRSMNYIIENEPKVIGIVEEVHDDYVIMYSETADGYPNGSHWNVPLEVENSDSYTDIDVGDEIVVYYDGSAMETDPLQIATVHAITLRTPADRTESEKTNNIPTLEEVSQMKYKEVNEVLSGRTINELRDAWGEPVDSDESGDSWQVDNSMIITVKYDLNTNSGIVESCELICGTPLAPAEE